MDLRKTKDCVLSAPPQSSTFLLNAAKANVSQRQRQGCDLMSTQAGKNDPEDMQKATRGRFRGECDEQEVP